MKLRITNYKLRILHFAFCVALTACAAAPTPEARVSFAPFVLITSDPNASPTPTPFQPAGEMTAVPTFTSAPIASETPVNTLPPPPTQTLAPTILPTQIAAPSVTPSPPPTPSSRTNYILFAALDFKARMLNVDETIRYYNNTGSALSDIVLSVQPNRYGGFVLNSVALDNVALTSSTLNAQRLTLNLPQPLQAGAAVTLTLNFKINIPAKASTGIYGYDFNQINLMDWYPFVVPYRNGWILHDPASFGEHLTYDSSDVEVNLKTDSNIVVAASAPAETNGEWTRYRLYGARTFTISASDEFLVAESAVGEIPIRAYYFSGYKAAAESALYSAAQAINLFGAKFAPYPYESLAIVQADIHDGQEYDGLVFLATDFYGQYGGGAKNNLTTIGVHEIAHQWWFGLVGNDQATDPWLDEAMSAYSERLFFEYNYPRYGDWWWQYRVDYFKPSGYVDSTIYSHGTFRAYTNAVYLNGAHFLEDLRVRMGDDDFFRFLKDYATRYSRGHAAPADFFAAVRANTKADISDLIAKYFSEAH